MPTILFLCTGNYYRSRFAEEWFNYLARQRGLTARADSCGLQLQPDRNPGPISPLAIQRLAALGLKLPEPLRFPRAVREEDLQAAFCIVALKEAEHRILLQQQFPAWTNRVEYWHIHDLDCAAPEVALAELAAHVEALLKRLEVGHAAA
jgi:protein-tyrosine phosphatase